MSDEGDATRRFSPFDDDATQPGGPRPDDTIADGGHQAADGGTRPMPVDPGEATVAAGPGAGARDPDPTSVMPPVDDRVDPAWSGRAEVRPSTAGATGYPDTDWTAVPVDEPRGRWWMPILVGILALVLLALLGWAIYLIVQNSGGNETPAPPATTPVTPATPASTVPTTTTTTPTTQPTTTKPTTVAPPPTTNPTLSAITVPALRGLALPEAQAALNRTGLGYRLVFRSSDAKPGTVIDSDPEEGQEVPPDTTVALVVAASGTPTTTGGNNNGNGNN